MHLFRDVGSGVVDHHNLRVGPAARLHTRRQAVGDSLSQHLSSQSEVDESGTSDFGGLAQISNLELGDDLSSDLAR